MGRNHVRHNHVGRQACGSELRARFLSTTPFHSKRFQVRCPKRVSVGKTDDPGRRFRMARRSRFVRVEVGLNNRCPGVTRQVDIHNSANQVDGSYSASGSPLRSGSRNRLPAQRLRQFRAEPSRRKPPYKPPYSTCKQLRRKALAMGCRDHNPA